MRFFSPVTTPRATAVVLALQLAYLQFRFGSRHAPLRINRRGAEGLPFSGKRAIPRSTIERTAGTEFFKIALRLTAIMYALPPQKGTVSVELPERIESQKIWKLGQRDRFTTLEYDESTTYEHHDPAHST
jgi:hypothetical protein